MLANYLAGAFSKFNYLTLRSDVSKKRKYQSMGEIDDELDYPEPSTSKKSRLDPVLSSTWKTKLFNFARSAPFLSHVMSTFRAPNDTCDMTNYNQRMPAKKNSTDQVYTGRLKSKLSLTRSPLRVQKQTFYNPFVSSTSHDQFEDKDIPVISLSDDDDDDEENSDDDENTDDDVTILDKENSLKLSEQQVDSQYKSEQENFYPGEVRSPRKNKTTFVSLSKGTSQRLEKKSRKKRFKVLKSKKFHIQSPTTSLESYRHEDKESYRMILRQYAARNSYSKDPNSSTVNESSKFVKQKGVQTQMPKAAFFKVNLTDCDKLDYVKKNIELNRQPFHTSPWDSKLQAKEHVFLQPTSSSLNASRKVGSFSLEPGKFSNSNLYKQEKTDFGSNNLIRSNSIEYLGKMQPQTQVLAKKSYDVSKKIENKQNPSRPLSFRRQSNALLADYFSQQWLEDLKGEVKKSKDMSSERINDEEMKFLAMQAKREEKLFDANKKTIEQIESKFSSIYVHDYDESEEEDDFYQLPSLTPEMEIDIEKAMQPNPQSEVLAQGFGIHVMRKDIETLSGLNWLNDEIINFYTNLLMERGKEKCYPSCYSFNTFFYPKLISSGHSALKRWTRKVDVFSYDLLLIPVHLGMHWCLAVIDFRHKKIQYYDSMGGQNNECLNALRLYLQEESKDKKKQEFDTSDWKLEAVKNIPQQMNGSDCGMFTCKYAEYITRNAKITFTQKNMPYFRRRMVYEIIKKKLL